MSKQTEVLQIPGKWEISYQYSAGKVAIEFFRELKDNNKIMGTRCPNCQRVYLPPRSFCDECFVKVKDWVELAQEGTLESFTIVEEKFLGLPDPPYVVVYVKLDGASTCLANFLVGVDLSNIEKALKQIYIGMRVKAVFKEQREGRMTDFVFETC